MRPSPANPITMFGKQYLQLHYYEVDDLCQWVIDNRESHRMGAKFSTCGRSNVTITVKPTTEVREAKITKRAATKQRRKGEKVMRSTARVQ